MIKSNEDADLAEIRNVHLFSEQIATAIREASNAVHPAAMVGILQFHSQAVCAHTQAAFQKPSGPVLFVPKK